MGWSLNPAATPWLNQLQNAQPARNAAVDSGWNQFFEGKNDLGVFNPELLASGARGRDISTGAGVDPRTTNAGGADQWNVAVSGAERARVANSASADQAAAGAAGAAQREGAGYLRERAGQNNQFALGKAVGGMKGVNENSKYVVSPWLGMVSSLLQGTAKGAASGLANMDTSDASATSAATDAPMDTSYTTPPWADPTLDPSQPGYNPYSTAA